MAEARDNNRGPGVRIRHIPIHTEGDGGLCAPLYQITSAVSNCQSKSCLTARVSDSSQHDSSSLITSSFVLMSEGEVTYTYYETYETYEEVTWTTVETHEETWTSEETTQAVTTEGSSSTSKESSRIQIGNASMF